MRMWNRACALAGAAVLIGACSSSPPPVAAPSPTSLPPSSAAPQQDGFTVVATGDVLIHPALTEQAEADGHGKLDYRPLLAGIKPLISGADLGVCHLETPLAQEGGPYSGYPSFSAPPEIADALKDIGYDTCSTSSNHTLDQGAAGIERTLDKLDEAGLKHTGSARSAKEAATPLILDVHGVKVAQLSYAFGFNGIKVPAGKPWLANQIDADAILDAAKAARAAGAQVVIVSLHWGIEYQHEVTAEQRTIAKQFIKDLSQGNVSAAAAACHSTMPRSQLDQASKAMQSWGTLNDVTTVGINANTNTTQGSQVLVTGVAQFSNAQRQFNIEFAKEGDKWKIVKFQFPGP